MAKHPNVASQSDDEKNAAYQLYKANWKEKPQMHFWRFLKQPK